MVKRTSKVIVGGKNNFWLWSEDEGFDLTHPTEPASPPIYPRITLQTRAEQATIDPKKTALVVVDLQNYFLSPVLGRPADSIGLKIVSRLVEEVIPACREANIPVVWIGWGLDEADLEDMPPAIVKGYQFNADKNFDKPTDLGISVKIWNSGRRMTVLSLRLVGS